jgi:hypothetical protein
LAGGEAACAELDSSVTKLMTELRALIS